MPAFSTPAEVLRHYWGYDTFRPLQQEIIDSVLSGADTLGLLPTGGGKSITFQVPAMLLPGLTVVITPLISLMNDQVDNLLARGIRAGALHSGLTRSEARLIADRCRLGKIKILYLSPEKLRSEEFAERMRREMNVSLIVVDEAHCISQWGYDFRPSYLLIGDLRDKLPGVPVLALTASATPEVTDDIMTRLRFTGRNLFARSFTRDNLSYIVRNDFDKLRQLLNVLTHTTGSAIVYTRSRVRTREIAALLNTNGISADYYHAGLDIHEKNERQEQWKSGQTRVMVATNAFGMGIDKPDVRTVVHVDLPLSLEEYYQEAGRAGRDGRAAFAVLLVSPADKARLTRAVADAFPPKDYIRRVYELAGNFCSVAVGEGFGHVYEFNFALFLKTYSLQPVPTRSALMLLTRAGWFEYVDDATTAARVMVTAPKHELYGVDIDSEGERVFNTLLRSYTGLFADYVYINEGLIARRAEVSEQKVYETMLALSRMHVISYVPRRSTPYIHYTTSRELPKHVDLPRAVYEDMRERMAHRIASIRAFAFGTEGCRVNTMLRYFGEKPSQPCGQCDLCRAQRRRAPADTASLERSLIYMVGQAPRTIGYLIETSPFRREDVIEAVRSLASRGLLRIIDTLVTLP